jgi:hypothetical protein
LILWDLRIILWGMSDGELKTKLDELSRLEITVYEMGRRKKKPTKREWEAIEKAITAVRYEVTKLGG